MSADALSDRPARLAGRLPGTAVPGTALRLLGLVALALIAITVFMTIESRGNWDFVIPFRGRKIIAMVVVGYAIAVSTVMFQTVTGNRILTPSIMGLDALYLLVQTLAVFLLGSASLVSIDDRLRFGIEVAVMVVFSWALYWWLFLVAERSLHLLVLIGIVFGVMFRSVTNLLQRMIDPTEFAVLQDVGFASFNAVDESLLLVVSALVVVISLALWRLNPVLDTLSLGRETAIGLGVEYRRTVMLVLAAVSTLVAVSTALVGPITFFGLLVAHVAYIVMRTPYHRFVLPAAAMIAVVALVAGQLAVERLFGFTTSLSIVIEFAGGIVFIVLLLRGGAR